MSEHQYTAKDAENAIEAAETFLNLVERNEGQTSRTGIIAGQIRLARKALEWGMEGPAVKMAAAAILL